MVFAYWLLKHLSDFVENFGMLTGLLVAGFTFLRDAKVRRVETIFRMNEHHRQLWMHFYSHPELKGVLNPKRDMRRHPLEGEELHFVNFLFYHLYGVYRASKAGIAVKPAHLADDVRSFLTLPGPQAAWERLKSSHDDDFVAFVERCLAGKR